MAKPNKAVVVFSGGQDSTTCLFWAKKKYDEVIALSFNYGQRHSKELECAKKICKEHGVEHHILDMELLNQLMERKLYMYRSQLENKKLKLEHLSPMTILDSRRHQLIQTGQRMENAMNNILLSRKHQLEIYASKLHGLSPLEKLSQGYSYVESIQGKPVNSVKNIDAGDKVKIYFKDGNVDAQVLEVNNGKISDN